MDATPLGVVTAKLMEHLSEDDSAELGEVLVLAEVLGKDDEGDWTTIAWHCSDDRAWVQLGLMHAALDSYRETDPE